MTDVDQNKNGSELWRMNEKEPLIVRRVSEERSGPRIISLISGKGGVGQTMLCANIGVYLAQSGKRVLLVDAVRWGQNLHTFLNIPNPTSTLDVLKDESSLDLNELITDTPFQQLKLLCGVKETPAATVAAESPYVITKTRQMPFDFVILDLGAHLSFNMLDHALWSDNTLVTTVPEPTSIENTYELLRALYFRLFKTIEKKLNIQDVVEKTMRNTSELGIQTPRDLVEAIHFFRPEAGDRMKAEIERYRLRLLVNQIRSNSETEIGQGMGSVSRRYFGLRLEYIGGIDYDNHVPASIRQRKLLHVIQKESNSAKQIEQIAHKLDRKSVV